jgi:RND family efflux transporter MFP subunit
MDKMRPWTRAVTRRLQDLFLSPARAGRAAAALALAAGTAAWLPGRAADAPAKDAQAKAAAGAASAASGAARPTLSVAVTTPQQADWPQVLSANGNIAAWQEAVIGAESAGLRLVEVKVNVGDAVRRGQLLAQLSTSTLKADVDATRASLAEARAVAEEAHANAERARQLQPSGAISAQQIQQYLTAEQTAKARIQALQARLVADEQRLAQTRVVASDDGVISSRSATVGAVVNPGQELFRLIRQQRLEWRAEVAAADLVRLRPGLPVTVTPAGGTPVKGVVRMVAPTVDAGTRNGLVYVDLPAPGAAKAGMYARGDFEFGRSKGLTLPQSAVWLRDGFSYVFRLGADNKVAMTKVGTGRRVGERVEITSGLDAGAKVVASGGGFLGDGDTVRVVGAP